MPDKDLSKLSLEELKILQSNVKKAIDSFEDRRRKEAIAVVEAKAREMGFSVSDLYGTSKKDKLPLPPKYRHPEDPSRTWSGRGRKPHWINEATANGQSLDEFLIA
ncbi:H-NS family nucleoid-associated regulatory protein [Pseudoruegeria sp. SK021]|uniref:H-NS histone family protein n=1 Tax=Pseudoruegeria sp. SK021 TaxID=1933035 RepID=UPI000A23AEBB|nr:H-NS histone family protein [Pseudoruegeria sp. SK021]OSP55365.1 transcriptional regulator [Pseudoruegeria sp. SK021]